MAEEHEFQEIHISHHPEELTDHHAKQSIPRNVNDLIQYSEGDSANRPPNPDPEHSSTVSTNHSPSEPSHQPAFQRPHASPEESLSERAFPSHSLQHSRDKSPQHSSEAHRQQSPSSDNIPQYSSVNFKTSTSHGVHDETKGDRQWSVRNSISHLFNVTTAALDSVLPSPPLEIPPSDATFDSQGSRRVQVAFAGGHDESNLSTASMNVALHDSAAFKSRALSARFFESPVNPPRTDYTLRELFFIAYQTLGVVYGDLGTSPLYVYPTINVTNPTEVDFLGILSLIFWTLTLIGVVKYSLIVLQADDQGEGGTFALYSLLCQHANIGQHHGEESPVHDVEGRRLSHMFKLEERPNYSRTREFLENNRMAQQILLFFVMMGTCMLIGDGILTPAISVISAIEGIQTAAPNMSRAIIVIISAIILILLFLLQRFGTDRVSLFFSPVMAAWFITTPAVGIYNIVVHYPTVFKAFSPAYIVHVFRAKGKEAWLMLGGTVLCITGAEAMYADMGHFNKHSIRIAFCLMVYPSVLLTYAGQTAYLIRHPEDHSQGFFKMIPKRVFWPMFIISTLAAVVASQSLISATFSVIKQSVALEYFPRVKLVRTSEDKEGQIYSPEVNYILMVLCLVVTFGFRSSATIGNAFGVAVMFVMLITTCLMSLGMLVIWGCRILVVLCFFLLFFCVEGVYISSVVTKVPQGGWLPFVVALVVTLIMFSWHMGCQAKYRYEMRNQITNRTFDSLLRDMGSVRVPGVCFFYTDLMGGVPPIVQHYISNVRSLHRVLVFTTVRFLPVKTVLPSERFLVGRAGFDGVYRCVARYGYRDVMKIQNNEFLDQFVETLKEYIESPKDSSRSGRKARLTNDEEFPKISVAAEVSMLQHAREDGAVYVMGRVDIRVSKTTKFITRIIVGKFYRFLNANCRSEVSTMDIPYANYLEIGLLYDI